MKESPHFAPSPKARTRLEPGALYAIDAGDSYIYYGQVAADKSIGFFKYRSVGLASSDEVVVQPLMSRFDVALRSIGEALRTGAWAYLRKMPLRNELAEPSAVVQWPVGTLEVTIWRGADQVKTTQVHDPEIQALEVIASYDAVHHVPARLIADYVQGPDSWIAGGPILRERKKKEQMALRFPEAPWHSLPPEWVPVEAAI